MDGVLTLSDGRVIQVPAINLAGATDGTPIGNVDDQLKTNDIDNQEQVRLTNFLLKEILRQIKITNTHLAELSDYNEEDFEMDME